MGVEKSTEWRPPPQSYGGQDITQLYSQMLVDQTVAIMIARTRNINLLIAQGMDMLENKKIIH